jgi:metal-sulfur cluster biosynthetic enzyme
MFFEYLKKNKLKIFLVGILLVVFELVYFVYQGWDKEKNSVEEANFTTAESSVVEGEKKVVPDTESDFQELDLKSSIELALEDVKDPEFGGPITDFTNVSVESVDSGKASIRLGIPSYCPFKDEISQSIEERLLLIEGVNEVEVILKEEGVDYDSKNNEQVPKERE